MATATKTRRSSKKNPVVPSRDEVIAKVLAMGGEYEKKRYEEIETLEKTHGQEDVLHRWSVGSTLSVSVGEHGDEAITIYSVGLQVAPQLLRLSVRLFELYKLPQLEKLLNDAANTGHALNWAHFRQLMRAGLTDAQRAELVTRTVDGRWGYRELDGVITAILGGKKSKGGRKPGKTKYKTYVGAISAMRMRSRAWLALEEDWIVQVKDLVSKASDDAKHTPEFLAHINGAAEQLRVVATRATQDAEEAETIALTVAAAMGNPKLVEEPAPEPVHASNGKAQASKAKAPKVKAPKTKTPKVKAPKVKKKRIRLAKHPKQVNGKFVDV